MAEASFGAPRVSKEDLEKRLLSGSRAERGTETAIHAILLGATVISVATTVGIVFILLSESFRFFAEVSVWEFLTGTKWTPRFVPALFGVLPLVAGTVLIATIAILIAGPVGLFTAIFLSEYAPDRVRRIIKPLLEILAGIPTVVYGFFALYFVTPLLREYIFPDMIIFNALSAGLVMGVMIIPIVSSLTEDAMLAVPRSLREAAYALGATRFEVATRVVTPAALSGIVAALILGLSRAIGETMLVTIAAGVMPSLTFDPREPTQTMTAYIVQVSFGETSPGTTIYYTIFAVGLLLFVMTLAMNILGHWVVRRWRQAY